MPELAHLCNKAAVVYVDYFDGSPSLTGPWRNSVLSPAKPP